MEAIRRGILEKPWAQPDAQEPDTCSQLGKELCGSCLGSRREGGGGSKCMQQSAWLLLVVQSAECSGPTYACGCLSKFVSIDLQMSVEHTALQTKRSSTRYHMCMTPHTVCMWQRLPPYIHRHSATMGVQASRSCKHWLSLRSLQCLCDEPSVCSLTCMLQLTCNRRAVVCFFCVGATHGTPLWCCS